MDKVNLGDIVLYKEDLALVVGNRYSRIKPYERFDILTLGKDSIYLKVGQEEVVKMVDWRIVNGLLSTIR